MSQFLSAGSRRDFLRGGAYLAGAGVLNSPLQMAKAEKEKKKVKKEENISPSEDLMREHGLLHRLLLIFEDAIPRLTRPGNYPIELLATIAGINRSFIEDYHERNEELQVFPHFEKAGTMTELVQTLRRQHDAGRRVTNFLMANSIAPTLESPEKRKNLAEYLQMYIRMYGPHAARETTVLFPAFEALIPEKEYKEIGERFEKKEHELFGEDGFEKVVEQIAVIERKLGLYELAQYTPPV